MFVALVTFIWQRIRNGEKSWGDTCCKYLWSLESNLGQDKSLHRQSTCSNAMSHEIPHLNHFDCFYVLSSKFLFYTLVFLLCFFFKEGVKRQIETNILNVLQ